MTEFTPLEAILGGSLIGLASVLLMAFHGRIAGMTGILAGMLPPVQADWPWRASFLFGAVLGPVVVSTITGTPVPFENPVSIGAVIVGGIIVGLGVNYGSGCTSGHGVCGMARLSLRSIAATATFMAATFVTVFVIRHLIGGI
ncbi:YeeE/YedE family protein [Maritalea sp.]|uniref:YeeE/YedE family protein n=1 Tax=Maritalea sp. TaxID=2003361 RepID=UPI003EF6DDA1